MFRQDIALLPRKYARSGLLQRSHQQHWKPHTPTHVCSLSPPQISLLKIRQHSKEHGGPSDIALDASTESKKILDLLQLENTDIFEDRQMEDSEQSVRMNTHHMGLDKAVLQTTRSAPSMLVEGHAEQGRVKSRVYLQYIEAASKTGLGCYIVSMMLQQVFAVAANNVWRIWGESNLRDGQDNHDTLHLLLVYGAYSLSSIASASIGAMLLWALCSVRSSQRLHNFVCLIYTHLDAASLNSICLQMLNAIIRAPLTFFETTPHGQ